jgi:hypothetical protein
MAPEQIQSAHKLLIQPENSAFSIAKLCSVRAGSTVYK